jgi:lysophospholipase L1-like esterase
MLVLGDSILWGQGLKAENKPIYQVQLWLEKITGRRVVEKIQAHSGAVIERASVTDPHTSSNPEVNLGLPTINDELDSAIRFYADTSQVDLVLISGCGNDVGVQNLLNALNSGEVDNMTQKEMRQTSREFAAPHHECLSSRAGNLDWLLSILLGGNRKRFRAEGSGSTIF